MVKSPHGRGAAQCFAQDILKGGARVRVGKPNAIPGGQRGGMNPDTNPYVRHSLKMAANRAKLQNGKAPSEIPGGLVYGAMTMDDGAERTITGTSIFDPVLCELAYRWFCPVGGLVLDPFAGGSVRGIVASKLGRRYVGVDLRPEQIEANRSQAKALCADPRPEWIEGDSQDIKTLVAMRADFVFSCPPYADLEVYSDDSRDLSTMAYADFLASYRKIVAGACELLKPDRFACFVVGDVRGKDGLYRGFPWHTVQAFTDAGLGLYNEAVLVTAVGSLPIRVRKQFEGGRKMGKTHQNVLVFVKGDWKKAAAAVGPVEFGDIEPTIDADAEFGEAL